MQDMTRQGGRWHC